DHVDPERVNAQTAPALPLSYGPPISAVLPSPDNATLEPCSAPPTAPAPTSFEPRWDHVEPDRVNNNPAPAPAPAPAPPSRPRPREHPRRPPAAVVTGAADQRRVAIGRQRDARALPGTRASHAGADQLRALLRPRRPRTREHPRRARRQRSAGVVVRATDQR